MENSQKVDFLKKNVEHPGGIQSFMKGIIFLIEQQDIMLYYDLFLHTILYTNS